MKNILKKYIDLGAVFYLLSYIGIVLLIFGALIAFAAWDGATNYPAALDDSASLYDVEDDSTIEDEHHDALAQAVIAIQTLIGASPTNHCVMVGSGVAPMTVLGVGAAKEVLKGVTGADPDFVTERAFSTQNHTSTGNITEAHIIASKWHTNNGAAGEVDLTLPALSYTVGIVFIQEEIGANIMEINPPSGELFDHDGTNLDADDCIDSPNTVGAKIAFTRILLDDGSTWRWSTDTIRDVWPDTGASD